MEAARGGEALGFGVLRQSLESWFCTLPGRRVRHHPTMLPGFGCPHRDLSSLVSWETPREVRKHCYLAKFVPSWAPSSNKKHLRLVTVTQQEKQRWRKWPWCQSKGNSPPFPCCSAFPGETWFFPIRGPGGVPARPRPCRVPSALLGRASRSRELLSV